MDLSNSNSPMKSSAKITIKGLVQGVGYRHFCYKKALLYKINGYVSNLYNGDVELEVEGEKNMIYDFIRELKVGPFNAKVNSVKVEELNFENKFSDFKIH